MADLGFSAPRVTVLLELIGSPPSFAGFPGVVHDRIIDRMREVFFKTDIPLHLDQKAGRLLINARKPIVQLRLDRHSILRREKRRWILATWAGNTKTNTHALVLASRGFRVGMDDGFLEIIESRTCLV